MSGLENQFPAPEPHKDSPPSGDTTGKERAVAAERNLGLIKSRMLNRTDWLAHKAAWGTDCPLEAGDQLDDLLRSHLLGKAGPQVKARWYSHARKNDGVAEGPFRLGTYSPGLDGNTLFAVIDFDGSGGTHKRPLADPLGSALAVLRVLGQHGVIAHLERSKSGTGWHLWVFFEAALPAALVRRVLFRLMPTDLPLTTGELADARRGIGIEVFPKQDTLDHTQAKLGNQVSLPWWHGAEGDNNQFHLVSDDGTAIPHLPIRFDTVSRATMEGLDSGADKPQEDAEAALRRIEEEELRNPVRPSGNGYCPNVEKRAIAYLGKCAAAVSGQGGGPRTMGVARSIVWGFDVGEEAGFNLLKAHWNPTCQPPWSDSDLRHKCHDATTPDPSGRPRGYLLDPAEGHSRDLQDSREPPWGNPIPLGETPAAPRFPLEALCGPARKFVQEGAAALPCPPDFLAVPLLAVASVALGQSRVLAIKETHHQPAILFVAVVGEPGSTKSPAQKKAMVPLKDKQKQALARFRKQLKEFKRTEEEYQQAKKTKKKGEDLPRKPDHPIAKRWLVSNTTVEALPPILEENPRGVLLEREELTGWVTSLNQYKGGKGSDRQFWLSVWDRSSEIIDRRSEHDEGPLFVSEPFISVVGGTQPAKLPTLRGDDGKRKGDDDGFLDRILFAFPEPVPDEGEQWGEIAPETARDYKDLIDRLLCLEMVPVQDEDGEPAGYRPFLVKLSSEGKKAWEAATKAHACERNADDFPEHLRGPWAKLRGYLARLALIVHYLRWGAGEVVNDPDGRGAVDGEDIRRAVLLVDYFKGMARRVYACMDADKRLEAARKIWTWVLREKRTSFKRWQAYEDLYSEKFFPNPESLDGPLQLLESHNLIRLSESQETPGKKGRKPAAEFLVSPIAASRESCKSRE